MLLRNKSRTTRQNDAPPRTVNDGLDSSDDESFKPVFKSKTTTSKQQANQSKRVLPTAKSALKSNAKPKKSSTLLPNEDTVTKQPATSSSEASQKVTSSKRKVANNTLDHSTSTASNVIPLPPKKSIPSVAKMPSPTSSFSEDEGPIADVNEPLLSTEEMASLAALPPLGSTGDLSPVQWLKDPPPSVPNSIPRISRRSTSNSPAPFANDPLRGPILPPPPRDEIEKLNGNHFLCTSLLDYLLQCGLPTNLPDNVLIGSSNSLSWFESMNEKSDQNTSTYDADGAVILRRKYQFYSLRGYDFLAANCGAGHFSVVWVTFSLENEDMFGKVLVYDSLRRSLRNNDPPKKGEVLGRLLLHLQKFLSLYCFAGTKFTKLLSSTPDLKLNKAKHVPCPQQTNGFDCGLFALGTLLHLVDGCLDVDGAFGPQHVSNLRAGLYNRLTTNTDVTWEFLSSFFPRLRRDIHAVLKYVPVPEEKTTVPEEKTTDGQLGEDNDDYGLFANNDDDEEEEEEENPRTLANDVEIFSPKQDDSFIAMFMADIPRAYDTLNELNVDIDCYEEMAGFRLIIRNSDESSRIYRCGSHDKCCFRAKFGKPRLGHKIVLKEKWTYPFHSGKLNPPTAKGRAYKKRLKGRIEDSVDHAHNTQHTTPAAKDVMVTAGNYHAFEATYKQAYRAMQSVSKSKIEDDVSSFQLIIPYLERFKELNEGSTVDYEIDEGGHINRFFVCPAFMNNALRHARPVMSLDATHLKSKWKGVMYVASVKTPCDELFPVAMAITNENENEDGWTWFLRLLLTACEFLVVDHPKASVSKKYYTFVSDRQKGLINALQEVFPENHAMFCSIHIARNAAKFAGKKIAGLVYSLSKTSSHMVAGEIIEKIGKVSQRAKRYIEDIEKDQWRGTAWLDNPCLPPRYGICTSNLSESANQMFEEARDKSWLHSIDSVLSKMMKRIAISREKQKGQEGVVLTIRSILNKRWENVIGYEVYQLKAASDEYTIIRKRKETPDTFVQYTINVALNICECGEWQEYGFPCVDAMAYLRLHRRLLLCQVMSAYVDPLYRYERELEMLSDNIIPVCIANIARDGRTLPPKQSKKRQAGRPKKKRIRKRSRYAHTPEDSNVVCSRCYERGHNVRTCLDREQRAARIASGDSDGALNVLDLS
jgi:hypothetical protein